MPPEPEGALDATRLCQAGPAVRGLASGAVLVCQVTGACGDLIRACDRSSSIGDPLTPPPPRRIDRAHFFRAQTLAERLLKFRRPSATKLYGLKQRTVKFSRPLSSFSESGRDPVVWLMGTHPMTFTRYAIFSSAVLGRYDRNQLPEGVQGASTQVSMGHCPQSKAERQKRGGVDTHQTHLYRSARAP